MSLPSQPLSTIVNYARAWFRTSFPGFPMGVKQFFGLVSRALGGNAWMVQKGIEDLDLDIVPSTQSSTQGLSDWAFTVGLPNGGGGFGPLLPTEASGGQATLTGVLGTAFTAGITATAEDGTTQLSLVGSVSIPGSPPGSGSVVGQFVAVTAGSVGNLAAGTVMTWDSPPAGADSTFQLTSGLTSGIDTESNSSLAARILSRLQTPPNGGNAEDYILWSEHIAGIVAVYVYPRRSGTGTVDVVVLFGGSGTARVPSGGTITAVSDYIATVVPVDVSQVNVLAATLGANGQTIIAEVTPNIGFEFDWDDTSGPFSVDLYTPGVPAFIRLNTLAPASLKLAIDNYKNSVSSEAPRLQVLSVGSMVNPPVTAVDYVDGGGKTTLTLGPLPTDWVAPSSTENVYAYGPITAVTAPAILAYVDSLGPSKQSGYADPYHFWSDVLSINQIVRVAEEAVDTNGEPMVSEVPAGGVSIDLNTSDVQAEDTTVGGTPELLYAGRIAVIVSR